MLSYRCPLDYSSEFWEEFKSNLKKDFETLDAANSGGVLNNINTNRFNKGAVKSLAPLVNEDRILIDKAIPLAIYKNNICVSYMCRRQHFTLH